VEPPGRGSRVGLANDVRPHHICTAHAWRLPRRHRARDARTAAFGGRRLRRGREPRGIDFVNGQGFVVGQRGAASSFRSATCPSVECRSRAFSRAPGRLTGVSFITPASGASRALGPRPTTRDGGASWAPSATGTTADLTGIDWSAMPRSSPEAGGLICIPARRRELDAVRHNTTAPFYAAASRARFSGFASAAAAPSAARRHRLDPARREPRRILRRRHRRRSRSRSERVASSAAGTARRWIPVPSPTRRHPLRRRVLRFEPRLRVGQGGRSCAASDGGRTWEPRSCPPTSTCGGSRSRSRAGWACARGSGARTRDGGESWRRFRPSTARTCSASTSSAARLRRR